MVVHDGVAMGTVQETALGAVLETALGAALKNLRLRGDDAVTAASYADPKTAIAAPEGGNDVRRPATAAQAERG